MTTTTSSGGFADILARTQRIGTEIARPAAPAVDRDARFPTEAISALKAEKLMAAAIPRASGGLGLTMSEVSQLCQVLGQNCAASAMVYAMHQIQIACMARHAGDSPFFTDYLRQCADDQLLVASATSEVGVGGDMRSSVCAVERTGARFTLTKNSSVCSYGEHADAILITSRRTADAAAGDQVLTLIRKSDYQLERTTTWDTLGMRGTCSPGFKIVAQGSADQILAHPFSDVATATMVPYSHIVWTSCWLGIATDALAIARAYVRADARKRPGIAPFGSPRLAEAATLVQTMRSVVSEAAREYEALQSTPDGIEVLGSMGYVLKINNVKVLVSRTVTEVIAHCLAICGMAGYGNGTKFSLGRHLRDAHGAALMIANDRIQATNAALLLVHKD